MRRIKYAVLMCREAALAICMNKVMLERMETIAKQRREDLELAPTTVAGIPLKFSSTVPDDHFLIETKHGLEEPVEEPKPSVR